MDSQRRKLSFVNLLLLLVSSLFFVVHLSSIITFSATIIFSSISTVDAIIISNSNFLQTADKKTTGDKRTFHFIVNDDDDRFLTTKVPHAINYAVINTNHPQQQRHERFVRQAGAIPTEHRPTLMIPAYASPTSSPLRYNSLTQNDRDTYHQDIPLGGEISLTCYGNRQIRWEYPQTLANDRRLQIDESDEVKLQKKRRLQQQSPAFYGGNGPGMRFQSTLTVRPTKTSDTGMYHCAYADTYDNDNSVGGENELQRVNIFIFVNDWQHLFVQPKNYQEKLGGAMITLSQGESGIIPCVPTYSNATVTLRQKHHENHVVEIPLSNDESGDFRYAPTRGGIVIPFPSRPMSGQYECRAELPGGGRASNSAGQVLKVRVLNFIAQTKPPHPVIDRSRARHVNEGGSFTLSCYVNLAPTKEPIQLDWIGPSEQVERRARIPPITTALLRHATLDYEFLEVRRNLTLDNVNRVTDAGTYECRIQKSGQSRRTMIEILPYAASEKSHINIRPENAVEILNFTQPVLTDSQPYMPPVFAGGSPTPAGQGRKDSSTKFLSKFIVFRAVLDVFPEAQSIYWMRNGQRIRPNDEKYNVTQSPNGEYAFLRINDIDGAQDAGRYSLWVETNEKRQSADFQLVINIVPIVDVHAATDTRAAYVKEAREDYNVVLHAADQDHVLMCRAHGNPLPEIYWRWQECQYDTCEPSRRLGTTWHDMSPQNYLSIQDYPTSSVLSNLTIRATRPTWYQCRARNGMGAAGAFTTSDVLSVPSDIFSTKKSPNPRAFAPMDDQFIMSPEMPIEGDDVTLTCSGSKMLFERIVIQEHTAPGLSGAESSRLARQRMDTTYSFVQTVAIINIDRNDGGRYECYLYPASWLLDSREPKKRRLEMNIDEQQAPYIHRFEPADIMVHAVYSKRQDLQCIAHARPPAHYVWQKDGIKLEHTADDASHRFEDGGQVLVLPRVVEEDGGTYECVASNRVGEARHSWQVAVTGDPTGTTAVSHQRKHLIIFISLFVGLGFLIMLTCLLYACMKWRKEKRLRKRLQHLEKLLKTKGDLDRLDPTLPLSHQAELLEFKEQFEFPREKLRLLEDKLLGQGKFGKVVAGEAQGIAAFSMAADGIVKKKGGLTKAQQTQLAQRWIRVAVKVPRDHGHVEQLQMLMAELKVHMFVGHHLNVVNLLGAVTKQFQLGEMFVILEYCGNGSLKKFLLRHRTDENFYNQVTPGGELLRLDPDIVEAKRAALTAAMMHSNGMLNSGRGAAVAAEVGTVLTTNDIISFAYQMACGMAYLADKRVIHRDLAARNVLVTDNLVIKIADFGLAREGVAKSGENGEGEGDAEYSRSLLKEYNNEPLPVKWVAPECISESRFSNASDVWSFGITLWEIFSLGGDPYPEDKPSREFLDKIFAGYRLQSPIFAPRQMFTIMQVCWDIDSQKRPTFAQLQQLIARMMNNDEVEKYTTLSMQEPYQYMHLMANQQATNGNSDAWPLLPSPNSAAATRGQKFIMEQTPDNSGGDYHQHSRRQQLDQPLYFDSSKRGDDNDDDDDGRSMATTTARTPSTTFTEAATLYRPSTSITSAGGSSSHHRTPGATPFSYLPSPTSSTNSRPFLGTSGLLGRFATAGHRNSPTTTTASTVSVRKPDGVLETDLDAASSVGGETLEMNVLTSTSAAPGVRRNGAGRGSTRPLLGTAAADGDGEGYLNEQFSPARSPIVFTPTRAPINVIKNESFMSASKPRSTSSFKT